MIDYAEVVQKFHCEHSSSWASTVKLNSSTFVLQDLICSHGSTHQEKDILKLEGIMKLKRNNVIYLEVKWVRDRVGRLTATCN